MAAGHAAAVEQDGGLARNRFLEVRAGALLTSVALLEGALVLGLTVQREQESADPWVPRSSS
jgi:hypothetical protein